MKIILAHGRALNRDSKDMAYLARAARARGLTVERVNDPDSQDYQLREARLRTRVAAEPEPVLLGGFSMGAHNAARVAAALPERVRALFLIAPPFYHPRYSATPLPRPPQPLTLVHGWQDEVIPWEESLRYVREQADPARVQLLLVPAPHFFGSREALALLLGHFESFLATQALTE